MQLHNKFNFHRLIPNSRENLICFSDIIIQQCVH